MTELELTWELPTAGLLGLAAAAVAVLLVLIIFLMFRPNGIIAVNPEPMR